MISRRTRTLTYKGMALYEERIQAYYSTLKSAITSVDSYVKENAGLSIKSTISTLTKCRDSVNNLFKEIQQTYSECIKYLESTKTQGSLAEIVHIDNLFIEVETRVEEYYEKIRKIRNEKLEVMSEASVGSIVSNNSLIFMQRKSAEAKAASVKVQFAEMELDLRKQKALAALRQADIDSELELLHQKKEAAALTAEARELEHLCGISVHSDSLPEETEDPMLKVKNYVEKHKKDATQAKASTPKGISHFLLRKDLILTRLTTFNDCCENYQAWKMSFQSVANDMDLTCPEEIDLLVKHLGANSKRYALSLRTAYLHNPEEALSHIWKRLNERFGTAESVLSALDKKLKFFPRIMNKETLKLYDLADILSEIEGLKKNSEYSVTLSYFDSTVGMNPIISKLPYNLQQKWISHAASYKEKHKVSFPPFSFFTEFVKKYSVIMNDPSFNFEANVPQHSTGPAKHEQKAYGRFSAAKTGINQHDQSFQCEKVCLIHKTPHSLEDCRVFRSKTFDEKKKFISENKLCFRCLSEDHMIRECKIPAKKFDRKGGEKLNQVQKQESVESRCTELCGEHVRGKSCAKIVLVHVYKKDKPDNYVSCYAIVDEQSNRTLAKPELFSSLNINGEEIEYSLSSCSGISLKRGRKTNNLIVECIDGSAHYELPTVIECPDIPCNRDEIPTPSVAASHPHLHDLAQSIPEMDTNSKILLLLGRDITDVHHVLDQRVGPKGSPFAQRLPLGWVIVGEVCLGDSHVISNVSVKKTFIVGDGRASLLPPCMSKFHVSEKADVNDCESDCNVTYVLDNGRYTLFKPCSNVFNKDQMFTYDYVFTTDVRDDVPSLSVEDREFLSIMDKEFVLDSDSRWSAPLPFRASRPRLPNNRAQALQRAKGLQVSLSKNPVKKQHFLEFMGKLLVCGHAELAPELPADAECWYLPIFGVYHPKKPNKIRVVFDSSAQFKGFSLNSVLLQGPDLTNSLLGVLLRFRRDLVAVSVDVEQMFYCFGVIKNDRDYLRFFWHKDNVTSKPLVEYRMCKHVFGNSPSPAIASYGLRKAVEYADSDVIEFVHRNFYVDDGLTSCPSVSEAEDLIKRTQVSLAVTGLRIHKITSNTPEVMTKFPKEDLAADLNRINFEQESLPTQRSLGLEWDLNQDRFMFSNQSQDKPVTKRGILSTINSVFDPIGFLAPVIIDGRLILRDVVSTGIDWDEPLPYDTEVKWKHWLNSLNDLNCVNISRSLFEVSLSTLNNLELHIFSDASEKAIAAVVFIVGFASIETRYVSFVMGKAKVAPSKGHTIPRLELCAAVLATELYILVSENLHVDLKKICFYTDSRVVLGYIGNQSRRFYTYVSNRVQKIRRVSNPQQWKYIPSEKNPADVGTRGTSPLKLKDSVWLSGPPFLREHTIQVPEFFPLVDPQLDSEVHTNVVVMATNVQQRLGSARFERFSSWSKLLLSVGLLIHIILSFKKVVQCMGWHICSQSSSMEGSLKAKVLILKEVQYSSFKLEVDSLTSHNPISNGSALSSLDLFIDDVGLLRVGGRLRRSSLPFEEKHPIIIPAKHHVTKLLIRHFHESVHHQGRLFTEGAVRQGGYWVISSKRSVSSYIFSCVMCKKLRGRFETQKMSDLPIDRIEQATPFSYVGVDVFGPWQVVSRRTRSSQATAKRWAVLFTCLLIRAVHIEVVDEMSTSAFINALRRFIAIRGKVKVFRSDRGTNFVGATDHIRVDAINVEDKQTTSFFGSSGSIWIFNAPHSSHMGGVWERMIGVSRRILEAMLSKTLNLTHDVLVTLMLEVCAIINSRPIVPVSSDPDCPEILSPSAILTLKLEHDKQPVDDLSIKDLYKDQWKRVQYLAGQFWIRWRKEFLHSLQLRSKWHCEQNAIKIDDIVLLKDREVARNHWPICRINRIFPSADGNIRKVEVCFLKESKQVFLVRPIVELVLLVRS